MPIKKKPGDRAGTPGEDSTNCIIDKTITFDCETILKAITEYQTRGVHTFPQSRNKIPVVMKWNDKDFTLEQHQVGGFEGIGTCPGRWNENVMVFDVDGPEGRESWAKCLEQYGPLPDTFTVHTGRVDGGEHLYYKVPDGLFVKSTTSKFAKKLDLRGTRGQAVLPPTVHRSGKKYQWHWAGNSVDMVDPEQIPLLPEVWVKALIETNNAYFPGQKTSAPPSRSFTGDAGAYATKALEAETRLVAVALDGTRNDALNKTAFSLGQLVAGGELDTDTVESELMQAAASAGLNKSEAQKTIKSGMEAGAKSPRKAPKSKHTSQARNRVTIDPALTAARAKQILRDRAAPAQFKLEHLPDDFRLYVSDICQRTDTDPIIIVMAVLVSISALLNVKAYIPNGTYFSTLYPVLWVLIQDGSGAFKTTGLNKGTQLIWQRVAEIQDSIKRWEEEKKQCGNTQAETSKELAEKIQQAQYSTPLMPNKASAEGLLELMEHEHRGAILCSEFGEWLANMGKTHNAGLKALFTELFDVPEQYSYMTRGGGHMIIKRPFVSIMGLSTPQWIHDNINLSDVGSGFFARDLIFTPPAKRTIPPALPRITDPVNGTFEKQARVNIDSIQDKAFGLTSDARKAFEVIHQGIYEAMDKQCTQEERALLDPYAKRWSPYVLKLALIFQVLDDPQADIGIDAIIPAAAIIEYAMESTIYLFRGDLGLSPFQRNCEAVLKFIAKRGGSVTRQVILSSKILEGGARDYDEVLTMLVDSGKIEIQESDGGKKNESIAII